MTTHGLRHLSVERLEQRRCLAASIGWDGPGLGSAELLYSVGPIPEQLDRQQIESAIEAALDVWSKVADIDFQQTTTSGQSDAIDIRFTQLDGPGGTLARAYFPDDLNRNPIAGDIEFDIDESWEIGNRQGSSAYDLMLVAVHEIGHSLGLSHSGSESAVMHHAVSAHSQFDGLSYEDVDQVLELYAEVPPPSPAPPSLAPPPLITPPAVQTNPTVTATKPTSSSPTSTLPNDDPLPSSAFTPPTRTAASPPPPSTTPVSPPSGAPNGSEADTSPSAGDPSGWAILRHRLSLMRSALLRLSFRSAAVADSSLADPDWDVG